MPDIIIQGEIGWETDTYDVRYQFSNIKPEKDIEITLSSPGGSVFQGVQIGHMIRDHIGKTTLTISALAASMGSHISQNADIIKVNDDTAWMMHNPWMYTSGDWRELDQDSKMLKSLAGMLSLQYSKTSGQEKDAILALMDETTWLFGQEIVDAGFAHELIATEKPESKEDAIAFAKLQFVECMAKLKTFEGAADDYKKIAAYLPTASTVPPKPAKIPVKPTQSTGKTMNEAQFLAFLETNQEAKAFYINGMAYIQSVADASKAPDLTALSLTEVLAMAPQAQTEQTQALADAGKAVEAGKLNVSESKFLIAAVASGKYGESVNDVVADAFAGEASYREATRTIAQADESNAKFELLGVQERQPEATPAQTATQAATAQAQTTANAQALGEDVSNQSNKVQ